ncbi:MAG: hypothetical protein PHV20_06345 [Bacteroidales bacterium]|nr:hypothetical protein [Bacteroidales bacterium]
MERLISDNNFKLKFDGQLHQIDANVLISSLVHTSSIIQEINRFLDPGKRIEIKVKALDKGSFLVHLELLETALDALKSLFTRESLELGAEIIASLVGLIKIKKFLKGKSPKSIDSNEDKTTITNENGDILIIENVIFNIYENSPIIKDAISQNFDAINNDPSITGFEITDKEENPIIRVEREDFTDLSLKSEEVLNDERILKEAATLHIVRLSFEELLKWEFYYKGNKIAARIKDPDFYKLIDKGEAFSKGDILEVELQVNQKWDESVNTFVNKSYQVNKIVRHILRNEQQQFNFEE